MQKLSQNCRYHTKIVKSAELKSIFSVEKQKKGQVPEEYALCPVAGEARPTKAKGSWSGREGTERARPARMACLLFFFWIFCARWLQVFVS